MLRLYYIDGLNWEQVAERLDYSTRQINRKTTADYAAALSRANAHAAANHKLFSPGLRTISAVMQPGKPTGASRGES